MTVASVACWLLHGSSVAVWMSWLELRLLLVVLLLLHQHVKAVHHHLQRLWAAFAQVHLDFACLCTSYACFAALAHHHRRDRLHDVLRCVVSHACEAALAHHRLAFVLRCVVSHALVVPFAHHHHHHHHHRRLVVVLRCVVSHALLALAMSCHHRPWRTPGRVQARRCACLCLSAA